MTTVNQRLTSEWTEVSKDRRLVSRAGKPDVKSSQLSASSVELLESAEAIRAVFPEWRQLESELLQFGAKALFFQSAQWTEAFLSHVEQQDDQVRHCVFICRMNNQLVGILPLGLRNEKSMRILTGLTEPFQQYSDMLVAPGFDPKTVFAKMIDDVKGLSVDLLHLGQVREDSVLYQAIADRIAPSGEQELAAFVDVSEFENFTEYKKSVSKKNRKIMRNAVNRLQRDGILNGGMVFEPEEVIDVAKRTYEGRKTLLKEKGLTSRAFASSEMDAFLDILGVATQSGFQMAAFEQKIGDVSISSQCGFVHGETYSPFLSDWNIDYSAVSPGKLQLGEVVEGCMERGIKRIDFMIPHMPYKAVWANGTVGVTDYVLPLSLKGYVYNGMWLNLLRPLAKRLYARMSPKWRTRLLGLIIR